MHNLERISFADKIRAFPSQRGIGVTALGTDHVFDFELFGAGNYSFHQRSGNCLVTDLQARVGRFVSIRRQGPADARVIEDFCQRFDVFGIKRDLV